MRYDVTADRNVSPDRLASVDLNNSRAKNMQQTKYGVFLESRELDKTFLLAKDARYGYFYSNFLLNMNTDFVFLDIGANQGLYACIAGQNVNCTRVIALEPVPDTFEALERNIEANRITHKTYSLNRALDSSSGPRTMKLVKNHSGMASFLDLPDVGSSESLKVVCITVSYLETLLPPKTPIAVKLDVEGFETKILEELIQSKFWSRIASIFYEVNENWVDPEKLGATLKDAGMRSLTRVGNLSQYDVLAERA